jgi:peptidoglycan L-alanyl-D-glutamate endopeptidase CwlK
MRNYDNGNIRMFERIPVLLGVVLYFLLAAVVGAAFLLPTLRLRVRACWMGTVAILAACGKSGSVTGRYACGAMRGGAASWVRRLWRSAVANRWLAMAACCMLALPLILALVFRNAAAPSRFDDVQEQQNAVVAQLLQGEQLVPPPPLPPDVFVTQEVEQVRPQLVSASRDWTLLDEVFRLRLLLVFRLMDERYGYKMALIEGYRSPDRQNRLAALGASVTNAAAFQSYHQYGLASDCAFLRDGKLVISERDPWAMRGYQLYGETAESVGLTWGGRWKMTDLGHVELHRKGVLGNAMLN